MQVTIGSWQAAGGSSGLEFTVRVGLALTPSRFSASCKGLDRHAIVKMCKRLFGLLLLALLTKDSADRRLEPVPVQIHGRSHL